MKRIFSLILVICMMTVMVVGCGGTSKETSAETTSDTTAETTTAETTTEETTTEETTTEETTTEETTTEETTTEETTTEQPSVDPDPVTPPKSLKILAIGNSFSDDATEHLYGILKDAGIEDVIIGNLYIGGCSIDTHWNNMKNDSAAYEFRYYNNSATKNNSKRSISYALNLHDWDYITIQQVSQNSGQPETLGNLQNALDYINEHKTNENAKIYWHMTWAYQQNSGHAGFANYGKNQMTMYEAIVNTYENKVSTYDAIAGVIPSGTTIQNLRTSYIGDTLTRDGYHMTYDIGRYAAALTWFVTFTGMDATMIDWVPSEYLSIKEDLTAIAEAVNAAVENPFAVTASTLTEKPIKTIEMTDADKEILRNAGKNPEDYAVLDLQMMLHTYWNSGQNAALTSAANSQATNIPNFAASVKFDRAQLPVGSIIVIEKDYQYRPEGWISLSLKNPARPGNVTTAVVTVDEAWWGLYQYRAFNLSHADNTKVMTEADMAKLHVYIPKVLPEFEKYSELTEADKEVLRNAGKNPADYQVLNLDLTMAAYYNSSSGAHMVSGKNSNAGNLTKFIATQIFTKEDIPVGSVISMRSGYQYRPEGWTDLSTNTAKRPDNVSLFTVIVDDAWWGDFNFRAFNIAHSGQTKDVSVSDITALRIYVPKN